MVRCCNCDDRISLISGNLENCDRCGFSLAPEVLELNKRVEYLGKTLHLLVQLANDEKRGSVSRKILTDSACDIAVELHALIYKPEKHS